MTKVFIPVRGGSKSIPLKNIKPLNGKPLVFWTIDAAFHCPSVHQVLVSTDDPRIRAVVEDLRARYWSDKVQVVDRSPHTAVDTASTESALLDWFERDVCDEVILVQATSPLLRTADLSGGIEKFRKGSYGSLLSVVRQKRFTWTEEGEVGVPGNYDPMRRPRRQDWAGFFVENGAFYVTTRQALLQSGNRISGKVGLWEMDESSYFEIDEPSDWEIVGGLLKNRMNPSAGAAIRLFVTDCDGVLTDGGMYYGPEGEVMKKFSTRDGMGIERLRAAGIITAMITGEDSQVSAARAKKLKFDHILLGIKDKKAALLELVGELKVSLAETAYVGDDVNDLEVLGLVGLPFCVSDAVTPVLQAVKNHLNHPGGSGAVREAAEIVLARRQ